MRILFKYPTRSRPMWFCKTLETYYGMISEDCDFQFLITLDEDDKSMLVPEVREFLDYQPNLIYKYGKSKTKIEACNADMDLVNDWDILVLVSDDMIPIVQDFDKIIVDNMQRHFPDTDGVLHFNDGFLGKDKTATLSIIGKKMYERFGYVYHPDYKSFFCDNEFTEVVRRLKKIIYFPQVIIKHAWKGNEGDDLYRRNTKMCNIDERTYKRRKILRFPK